MSSGENTYALPMNRKGGVASLVQPEATTAAARKYISGQTGTTTAPSAASDGVPLRGYDTVMVAYATDGTGSAGAANLWVYYADTGLWHIAVPAITLTGASGGYAAVSEYDTLGADRVALQITTAVGTQTAGTDVWLLGRYAKTTT
jgi:hypothetical protein